MIKKYKYTCPHCGYVGIINGIDRCACNKLVIKQKDNSIYVKSFDKKKPSIEPCWVAGDDVLTLEELLKRLER